MNQHHSLDAFVCPSDDDSADVRDALKVASSLWEMGMRSDAIRWLQTAATAAAQEGHGTRAAQLKQLAPLLRPEQLSPPTVPKETHPLPASKDGPGRHPMPAATLESGMRPVAPPPQRMRPAPAPAPRGVHPSLARLQGLYDQTASWAEETRDESTQLNIYANLPFEQAELQLHADEHWLGLVELYLGAVETASDPKRQVDLLVRMAKVFEQKMAEPEQAAETLLTAYRLDGLGLSVREELEALADRAGLWGSVLETVDSWLEVATSEAEQVDFALQLAEWYAKLGRGEFALPLLSQVALLDPDNVRGMRLMAGLHSRRGEWRVAGRILEQALQGRADATELSRVASELAALLERFPEHATRCRELYQAALDFDASNRQALDALEKIVRSEGRQEDLAEIVEKKARAMAGSPAAAPVFVQLAGLQEALGRQHDAIAAYTEALDIAPDNLEAIVGLEKAHRFSQSWAELQRVLEMHIDAAATERQRVALTIELARLLQRELSQPHEATRRLEALLCIDPHNRDALEQLEQCYQILGRHRDRLECLERLLAVTDEPAAKLELLATMAQDFESKLDDLTGARGVHERMLGLQPASTVALCGLARIAQEEGRFDTARAHWQQLSELELDSSLRANAFFQLAKLDEAAAGEATSPRENYQRVLDLQPNHIASLRALRELAVAEERWRAAVRLLQREQELTSDPVDKASILVELSRIQADRLGEVEAAAHACQHALRLDPQNVAALWCLARCRKELGELRVAAALSQRLLEEFGGRRPRHDVAIFYAECCAELAEFSLAYAAYKRVVDFDASSAVAMAGMAESLFGMRRWDEAVGAYQGALKLVLVQDVELLARLHFRLGCSLAKLEGVKAAAQHLTAAFELDSQKVEYVVYQCNLFRENGMGQRALAVAERALDCGMDAAAQKTLLVLMATVFAENLKRPQEALTFYRKATALDPADHALLHRMLPLHYELQDWQGLLASLKAIVASDDVAHRRARYLYTMGQVHQLELGDLQSAAELFAEAVRLDAGYRAAFDALQAALVDCGQFSDAVAHYRRAIDRSLERNDASRAAELFQRLGLVFFEQLGDGEAAAAAFKRALSLDSALIEPRGWLAELACEEGDYRSALSQYRGIIALDAFDVDAYRSMFSIHRSCGDDDGAFSCAMALVQLGAANTQERQFVETLRIDSPPKINASISESAWARRLRHPRQNVGLARIFAAVSEAAYRAHCLAQQAQGGLPALDLNERVRSNSSLDIAKALRWGAAVLSVPMPGLYIRNSERLTLRSVVGERMTTVAGGEVCRASASHQAYWVGEHLSGNRRDQIVMRLIEDNDHRALKVLLYAALRLGRAQVVVPVELAGDVALLISQLGNLLSHARREELRYAVKAFVREGGRASVKEWIAAAKWTAARTGLLLCGNLGVALEAAQQTRPRSQRGSLSEDDIQLLRWSVSAEYLGLRASLGIQLGARPKTRRVA